MPEYIEREALEKALCEERDKIYRDAKSRYLNGKRDGFNEAHSLMLEIPAADVAPVLHGRWIEHKHYHHEHYIDSTYECSECNAEEPLTSEYCPNCGAKMDGGEPDA